MAQPSTTTRPRKPARAAASKPEVAAAAADAEGRTDALSSLAPLLRVRPIFDSLCRFGEQWASGHAPERDGWVPFHLVTEGRCVISVPGAGSHSLSRGDIALLPHGGAHVVHGADTPAGLAKTPGLRSYATSTITVKTNVAEGEAPTELLCGRLQFELARQNLVLAALPAIIVLRSEDGSAAGRLQQMMIAIRDELVSALPGAIAIANDLASALMVMVLRLHIAQQNMNLGLFGLLAQRQAARAVIGLIEQPDKAWTLDELADRAGASRATLVRLFQRTAGMAPLEFLTDLRLNLARNKLIAGQETMAEISIAVGYQSESAFSRAFSRHFGVAPSSLRLA
jgi:AraC family transcriptional activator of mtrCDE